MDFIQYDPSLAQAHLQAGRFREAEALYRQALAGDPDSLDLQNELGLALLAMNRFQEAVACFGKVLGIQSAHDPARSNLALALLGFGEELLRHGQWDPAAVCFRKALEFDAGLAQAHLRLGELLQAQGRRNPAIAQFERAVALQPDFIEALLKLGTIHAQVNQADSAAKWYRWALALDPTLVEANFNLASLLEGQARLAEAQIYRRRIPRPLPLAVETAPDPRRRVLIPWATGSGNVPIDTLMPAATTTRIKWFAELTTDEQEAQLPPFDLVFNGIGNADLAGPSLERLCAFHDRHPMLNPPEQVLLTRRDLMPAALAGIPGVVVPPVARLGREEVLDDDLLATLAAQELALPLLVRPIGTQGGKGARRVETPDQVAESFRQDADAFYVIGFKDYRSLDGYYRKYRMIFVDREPFPYHLAIASDWLVHYQSANMLSAPWKREEERQFLEDPRAVLGEEGYQAIEAIGRRLDLDYAGIDFSVLADGRILVFEANATMLVHLEDPQVEFPYKHRVVPAIFQAFEAMLERARA